MISPGRRFSRIRPTPSSKSHSVLPYNRDSYVGQQNTARRHQFQNTTTQSALALGDYWVVPLLFGVKTPGSPTASNNWQTRAVEFGSLVEDFSCKIQIKSANASPFLIDVYEVQLSFFDAYLWNAIQPTACPVDQILTAGATQGQAFDKAVSPTLIIQNTINNFKFVQHYIKYRGQLEFSANSGNDYVQEIIIDKVPPKCKRANIGMFWCLFFKIDSDRNTGATTFTAKTAQDYSFTEIPSTVQPTFLF